jgi:pimeloyl-ACP methyl ester carboxylesterase/2-polyprenyl-6-methoxyphenol hydroxylase-like FAD-dependent oxidoreductase
VTVLDRDTLPTGLDGRRAVPQGRHAHALLAHGQECMEELLPGLGGELIAAGAATAASLEQKRFVIGGRELARASTGHHSILASRPFIEGHLRRRVRAIASVELIDECDVLGLTASADRGRVTGVRILHRADGSAEEQLAADLVVAATGRSARVPAWLTDLGYPAPAEERLRIDVGYASRHLRLPADALDGDKLVLIGAVPGRPRALFLLAEEHDRWILGLGGYGDEHRPPSDPDAFCAFAATVAPPDVLAAIEAAEPLDDVVTHRFPASVRRRYERLGRFPAGLLVCGDAVCSFNPTYGQGMTVAAAEALALRDCLACGERELARRFFAAAKVPIDHAWELSIGADLALPEIAAPRPARWRAINAYLQRLRASAEHDTEVAGAFASVLAMTERPERLLRPAIARRVLAGPRSRAKHDRVPGVRRRTLEVDGVRTPLREAGPGHAPEAVVFVHGNPSSGADWEPLLAATAAHGLRTLAWDAPGFGRAQTPAEFPQTVEAHARFIGHVLDELGVDRAHLVLHDFGGPWGLNWAAAHPDRFASAVLLGTGALPDYSWHALARVWRAPLAGELFMASTTRPGFRLLLRRGQQRPLPRPFLDRMYDDFDRATRRAVLALYRSVPDVGAAGRELAAALRPLARPATVIWGRHDPYLRSEHAERQRDAFPHAELLVLDHAGHWPFIDEPDAVADALSRHLDRHAGLGRDPMRQPSAPDLLPTA